MQLFAPLSEKRESAEKLNRAQQFVDAFENEVLRRHMQEIDKVPTEGKPI